MPERLVERRRVASFDAVDRQRHRQDLPALDPLELAEVRAGAEALERRCGAQDHVLRGEREGGLLWLHGRAAELLDRRRERDHVLGLLGAELLEAGQVPAGQRAGLDRGLVEGGLEMLEREGVVEDAGIAGSVLGERAERRALRRRLALVVA